VPGSEPNAGRPGEQVFITGNSTGVAAIVNDFVISNYDLDQRTALFVATSGVRPTRENLAQIRAQVLRSLVDEVLELQEAQKHKVIVKKDEVDKALMSIAEDNKLTVDQILETIGKAGVTALTFRQQVTAQLTWQKLVSARYGSDIQVSEQQVDEVMNRLKSGRRQAAISRLGNLCRRRSPGRRAHHQGECRPDRPADRPRRGLPDGSGSIQSVALCRRWRRYRLGCARTACR
jgi:hypothetical protein